MTPAQLDALSGVERRASGDEPQRPAPTPGDGFDWVMLARLANGGR